MALVDYLPGLGDRSARKTWRELRQDTLALDVLVALAASKMLEQPVNIVAARAGLPTNVAKLALWAAAFALLTLWALYDHRIKEAADDAHSAVSEAASETAEVIADGGEK